MATTASEARKNLSPLIEKVNDDRTPIEIHSRRGDAVLLFRAEYDALEETGRDGSTRNTSSSTLSTMMTSSFCRPASPTSDPTDTPRGRGPDGASRATRPTRDLTACGSPGSRLTPT
jgi:prevent-host-death family protein